jgi:hypothetical protein
MRQTLPALNQVGLRRIKVYNMELMISGSDSMDNFNK